MKVPAAVLKAAMCEFLGPIEDGETIRVDYLDVEASLEAALEQLRGELEGDEALEAMAAAYQRFEGLDKVRDALLNSVFGDKEEG